MRFMKYSILCRLMGDIEPYHYRLMKEIGTEFHLTKAIEQDLPTHFTIKYTFEASASQMKEVYRVLASFCKHHRRTRISADGFGNFGNRTVFIKLKLSRSAENNLSTLLKELKSLDWLEWSKKHHEGNSKITPHASIAEKCTKRNFLRIVNYIKGRTKRFDCWFDTIIVRKSNGKTMHGWNKSKTVRTFKLQ